MVSQGMTGRGQRAVAPCPRGDGAARRCCLRALRGAGLIGTIVVVAACDEGRSLRRVGLTCAQASDCVTKVCYKSVCSRPCTGSDDDCDGGVCVVGLNVCAFSTPPDAGGGLPVDTRLDGGAALVPGACGSDADCLATERCAEGQCLIRDPTGGCEGEPDGASCSNYPFAVSCGAGPCAASWKVHKYGGVPTCKSGVCTPQPGAPAWSGESNCAKGQVCVSSKVGGVLPCQVIERVPACAPTGTGGTSDAAGGG